MKRPTLTALALLAPADAARAGGTDPRPVAEIVTFRLAAGVSEAAFLAAAWGTEDFVSRAPGFRGRRLSRAGDGAWTDHVVWASMAEAKAAAETLMADPAAMPFLRAIDPDSIAMRHETILLQME
jgi:hypothetical protein